MEEYLGFKTIELDEVGLANFYENKWVNIAECLTNEYLLVYKDDELIDQLRWDGSEYTKVPFRVINSKFLGKIKPRNVMQRNLIDLLYNDNITVKVTTGPYGSGKDMLMVSAALDLVDKGRYDKIVWVRNNIEVKDSKPIGHLPGDGNDKLLPYAMVVADHVGGLEGLRMMMDSGKIELVHLGFIRGRDIKNSIILCSEAENMTKEHIQLLIGRVGEGSTLWLNGDHRQTDSITFERNPGLLTTIDRLKGQDLFGYVKLLKTERSRTAALADLLDN